MDKQKNKTPFVRFPEFKDGWEHICLNELLSVSKAKNGDLKYGKEDVLSVSGESGIVNQIEHLGRSYAGVSVHNYGVVELNQMVYTKSPLKANPYGIIKLNKHKAGIVSTLYAVYKVNKKTDGQFIEYYFSLDANLNRYLRPLVKKGAKNDMKISNEYVLNDRIYAPQLKEQKNIAHFFNTLDKKINQLKENHSLLEDYKKGVMQQIFSQEIRFKKDNGSDFSKWNTIELGDIIKIKSGNSPSKYDLKDSGNTPFIKVEELNNCVKNQIKSRYYTDNASDPIPVNSVIFPKRGAAILTNKIRINSVPLLMDSNLMALICNPKKIHFEFLFYKIVFQKLYKIADTSTIPQINNKHIQPITFELPSLEEQDKIVKFLLLIEAKIEVLNSQIRETLNYKKGLIQQMFV
tara:strand:- start:6555 stop:7769 length:1215 start_codon:yes stop_codon:yes gene_type:complete